MSVLKAGRKEGSGDQSNGVLCPFSQKSDASRESPVGSRWLEMSLADALIVRVLGNLRRRLVMIHYSVLGIRPEWKKNGGEMSC